MNASPERIMYLALDLGNREWKLAFTVAGGKLRVRSMPARQMERLQAEIREAKTKLGLVAETRVRSCYEAGRDGFWLHRWLTAQGVESQVVDPASIEVNRRLRRAKTDRLDARSLAGRLVRYWEYGERRQWSVVRVPSEADEDARRPRREMERLTEEQTAHLARIRSLLVLQGAVVKKVSRATVLEVKDWAGRAFPAAQREELEREVSRLEMVREQLKNLERVQVESLKKPTTAGERAAAKLVCLKSLGVATAVTLGGEFFGWRHFQNRRQVGACAGLTGTPCSSGELHRELGISKAGNRRVRHLMVEQAWRWLHWQPQSELSRWYRARFGCGGVRLRRIGIVALARKLLVAFWKYVAFDLVPGGAVLKPA
jgi:transposase